MILKLLFKHVFKLDEETLVMLGTETQKGSPFIPVNLIRVWQGQSLKNQILSILKRKWTPPNDEVVKIAKDSFMYDLFGMPEDYGEKLFDLITWHNSKKWDFSYLTEEDIVKADAIEAMTILTRLRYEKTADILHLKLNTNAPFICVLAHPMVVKIPVLSFQYYLNVHTHYTFNSIRKAKHPYADNIIDYIYELLYLQQKTAIALHEYLVRINYAEAHKKDALFINAEINAIMNADLIFSYLKASIEKVMILVGFTYGINNLDSKKTHKAKLSALNENLPNNIRKLYYFNYMYDLFSSTNLDELNSYRSGILHKRGISDLQPHNYVQKTASEIPLRKIFFVLVEQHAKNTTALIGALALLTDKLVELDFPEERFEDIPQ